jgi:hypothetical protein
MPVENYGVLIGPYKRFYRDPVNAEGKYLHGHVVVGAGALDIDCAVDCNHSSANVRYVHLQGLDASKLGPVTGLGDGYHPLAPNSASGALDYARNPLITVPLGCAAFFYLILNWLTGQQKMVWTTNAGDSAVQALEMMMQTGEPIDRVLVYGARWNNPRQTPPWGMHDIHCNQGDPPGQFQMLDGVWQDGGVLVRRTDGKYDCFLVMFTTQTLNTDDVTGLPK